MKRLLIFAILLCLAGCSSAEWAKSTKVWNNHKVTFYSGGQVVRTWSARGQVLDSEKSDGYYFVDDATGKLIEVSGDVVIEQE